MPFFTLSSPSSGNATQLQGRAVSSTGPASGEVLVWNGSAWSPGAGVTGPTGAAGVDGAKIYSGTGEPSVGLGRSGDWYIENTDPPRIYGPKANGQWPDGVSLGGPTGPSGSSVAFSDSVAAALGTAAAGTSPLASRADHVHPVPVINYADLAGTPTTFSPSSHVHDDRYYTQAQVDNIVAGVQSGPAAGTYATLVNGTVPASQLPSYVDDVLEYVDQSAFPASGEGGKIYVAINAGQQPTVFRWSGSSYVQISASPGSTDAVPEGATNLYHTAARAAAAAPVQSVAGRSGSVVIYAADISDRATSLVTSVNGHTGVVVIAPPVWSEIGEKPAVFPPDTHWHSAYVPNYSLFGARYKGEYSATVNYDKGDIVFFDGYIYERAAPLNSGTAPTDAAYWKPWQLWYPAPEWSDEPGSAGSLAYSTEYLFVCVDSNSWRRIPFETFPPTPDEFICPPGAPQSPLLEYATPGDSGEIDLKFWVGSTPPNGYEHSDFYYIQYTNTVTNEITTKDFIGEHYGALNGLDNFFLLATITGLTNGVPYTFRIRGVSEIGLGQWSNKLTATPGSLSLSITYQPQNQTILIGEQTTFGVAAEATTGATISYQWEKRESGNVAWSAAGSTQSSISLSDVAAEDDGDEYRCVVTATLALESATVTSDAATLTVWQPTITITQQPTPQTTSGSTASFSINATTTANSSISAQWQSRFMGASEFVNVPGGSGIIQESGFTLQLTGLSHPYNGTTYRCVLNAAPAPTVISDEVVLTIEQPPSTPVLSAGAGPGDGTVTLSFYVANSGSAPITNWRIYHVENYLSENPIVHGHFFTNSQDASHVLTGLTPNVSHWFQVQALNAFGLSPDSNADVAIPTGGTPSPPPILLATFNVPRVVDSGPNNYWLSYGSSYYSSDSVATQYYGIDGEPFVVPGGKYSAYCTPLGYDPNNASSASLGVRVRPEHLIAQLESQSFTIEAWVKPTLALSANNFYGDFYFRVGHIVLGAKYYDQYESENYGAPAFDHLAICDTYLGGTYFQTAGNANAVSASLLPVGQWSHLAMVRDAAADEIRVYLDGALVITAVDSTPSPWTFREFDIGYSSAPITHFDQIRIMPGAIYSGATITPPAAGFSYTRSPAPAATTELLLNATHGLEDWGTRQGQIVSQGDPWLFSAGFVYPSRTTAVTKWGAGAYQFGELGYDGAWYQGQPIKPYPMDNYAPSGQWLPATLAVLDSGPWTIEAWVRPTRAITYSAGPESYAATDGETYIWLAFGSSFICVYDNTISIANNNTPPDAIPGGGTTLEFLHWDSNNYSGVSYRVTAPTSLARNQWHHIAVVADVANNVLRLKINGAEIGTIDISQTWASKGQSDAYSLQFGGTADWMTYVAKYFSGYMDDLRLSSAALYGTGVYTVPAGPLT